MTTHIISNQATCKKCATTIFSSHRHDYVECSCGAIMVDGGNDYLRHGWDQPYNFIDQSLTMDTVDFGKILAYTKEMCKNRNELGILYGVMRAIRDQGYVIEKKEGLDG